MNDYIDNLRRCEAFKRVIIKIALKSAALGLLVGTAFGVAIGALL